MTFKGDLLRVVERIEQMVKSPYNKYRKELASSKHNVKFKHRLESMPFLPPGIHGVLMPPAIERIREQDLLREKEQRHRRGGHPCSSLFEKTNGLPYRHTLQQVTTARFALRLNYFYNDHWRYQREQGLSFSPVSKATSLCPRAAPRSDTRRAEEERDIDSPRSVSF